MSTCPELPGAPEWEAIEHPALVGPRVTFLQSQPEDGLKVRFFRSPENHMKARAWFGPATGGPPGHVHGGCMAALLDEVVGGAAWLAGHPCVAANLDVKFRAMLPLHTVCEVTGRVERASGRRVHVTGDLRGPDGTVYAQAEALFVVLDLDRLPPMPDEVKSGLETLLATLAPTR